MREFIRTATALLAVVVFFGPVAVRAETEGSIRGHVVVGAYAPQKLVQRLLPRAVITFSGPAGTFVAHPRRDGFYVIFGMPPGKYAIAADIPLWSLSLQPGIQHVCIQAGEDIHRDLAIGLTDLPRLSALQWLDYTAQFLPDASQTADVYNVGGCDDRTSRS